MNTERMFEYAVRNKLRFSFKGVLSTEDLWDLSPQNLDTVFKTLNSQLKRVQEESLLEVKTESDKELELQIEIVKHIVKVKLEEANTRSKTKEVKEKKEKILGILAAKQDEDLQNKSPEELQAMLKELE